MSRVPGRLWQFMTARWRPLLPAVLFLLLSVGGIGGWSLLVQHHREGLVHQTEAVAEQFAIRIEEYFAARLHMAGYLKDVWSQDPSMSGADFRRLARTMLAKVSGIRAVNWIDATGIVRWVAPETENRPAVGLKLFAHPIAGEVLAKAMATARPAATPALDLAQGGHGVAVYVPLPRNAARQGFLNVVFRLDDVFPHLWREETAGAFGFSITDGDHSIYTAGKADGDPVTMATVTATVVDRPWTVAVCYFGPLAPGAFSDAPRWFVPVLAVFLSALIAGLVYSHLGHVSALQERERALSESEGRLRSFLDNSPALVLMKGVDGRYTLANNRLEQWFGVAPQTAIGRSAAEVFDAETARDLGAVDRQVWKTGEPADKEYRKFFVDGKQHTLVSTKFPVHDADGRRIAIGSFVMDVTEQRRTEAQLRQAQKMEAVGNMTGGLAHDFNNLLTIILGNLQMLERRLDSEASDMADRAIRAARRASEVTQRLLAFSRRHPLSPATTDLRALVGGFEGMLQSAVGPSVNVHVEPASGLWPSHIDPSQFEVAMINLAINARDAMPAGGRLTISMSNTSQIPAESDGGVTSPEDYVAVTVSDTGIGMSAEVLEQAVDPFFTTKARGRGTGLGLSMVYGFVKQSGGDMQIRSTPGKGTQVILFLPRAEEKMQNAEA